MLGPHTRVLDPRYFLSSGPRAKHDPGPFLSPLISRHPHFLSPPQEIQHAEDFLIKPESKAAQLDTSQWPLLLKVGSPPTHHRHGIRGFHSIPHLKT